ncbi:hypothetical protein ABZX77_48690 [Streptomyces sp. NPDC004237]|uniref:hypothetical protein n=1 Tax=Streptomyces sp. NPDC004237 TaxID=3154455 RepID=UPI0033A72A19
MKSALDTYLGWEQPQHRDGCKRPSWDVAFRTDEKQYRREYRGYGEPLAKHECPDEECAHGASFDRVTVRIVCRSCGAATVITGEDTEETGTTRTSTLHVAYGLAPLQKAGLLLWPAEPWLGSLGRHDEEFPHDFVVTRTGVRQVTQDSIVGQITQGRGKLRGRVWTTLAVPDPKGQYGFLQRIQWAHSNDGRGQGGAPLRTVLAAARWVGARVAEHELQAGAA